MLNYQKELYFLNRMDIYKLDRGLGGVKNILDSVSKPIAEQFASPTFIREGILRYNLLGDPMIAIPIP